jgi:hypothetical protein
MQHRTKDYTLSLASNVTITNIKFTFNISSIGRTNKNTKLNVNKRRINNNSSIGCFRIANVSFLFKTCLTGVQQHRQLYNRCTWK